MDPMLAKLKRLNLVLHTTRRISQILLKEKDRTRLLQKICDTLVAMRGYHNAWIALTDSQGQVCSTAEAKLGAALKPVVRRLAKGHEIHCMRSVMASRELLLIRDPLSVCTDCPLAANYAKRAAIAVPLQYDERIFGFMVLSTPREIGFDREEQVLVRDVAADIAFVLQKIAVEKELLASEKRFRDLVQRLPVGILIVQGQELAYENPEQVRIFGKGVHPFKAPAIESIHPQDRARVQDSYQRLKSGQATVMEVDFRFKSGSLLPRRQKMRWVQCRAETIEFHSRTAICFNMMDLTRAKRLEHLLKIQDKMASLGRIAAGIAHEIRNPLSGINIYIDTLENLYRDDQQADKVTEIFQHLQAASNKINSVIRRVIDFSKPSTPHFVQTDINAPIAEAMKLTAVTLRKSGTTIESDLAPDLPQVSIDPQMIEELMLNLLTNAVDAMKNTKGPKRIRVTTAVEKDLVAIQVSDSGPGVPPQFQEVIFDPFYTTKTDSTGIGLSLCHRIVLDHQGIIRVGNGLWNGAEFTIELPVDDRS